MFKYRLVLPAIAALSLGLANGAFAADMAVKASPRAVADVWSWTGLYVGVNGGYGWQGDNLRDTSIDYFYASFPTIVANTGASFDDKGGFGGGQIGYNFQTGMGVWGVEADFQGSAIKSRFSQFPAPGAFCCGNPADIFSGSSKLNWFGTVRGRLGFAFDRVLLYVTGGLAYGEIEQSINAVNPAFVPPFEFFTSSYKRVRTGGVVGIGGEYKITSNWSAKAEYQYMDLGSSALSGVNLSNGPDFTSNVSHQYQTVRFGINYLFGGPVVAKY